MKAGKVLLVLTAVSVIAVAGAVVYAAGSDPEKFQYFVKALEYGLKGLKEYFNFIIELFKIAVSG
jgi:hypothetical protein